VKLHESYKAALPFSICLQVLLLILADLLDSLFFVFALIPAVAYWIITPVVIYRHPAPTQLDLQMVRTGYAFYCLFAFAIFILFALVYGNPFSSGRSSKNERQESFPEYHSELRIA
jgi:hypothetical protein